MKFHVALLAALPLFAQTVTVSQQPGAVFVATFGAPLAKTAVYSAEVCSLPGQTATGSWGQIRQIVEAGGINVVDNILVPAAAQRAQSKTTLHKVVIGIGEAGLATAIIAVFHTAPAWLIEVGAGISGVASVVGIPLTAAETQAQATITTALGALAQPTAQFSVSNGACTVSQLFLGGYIPNFVPIHATLPAALTTPDLRDGGPSSRVPSAQTHPAVEPPVENAGWMLGDGWTDLKPDEAASERDTDVLIGVQAALLAMR
jgi:hypothetical protein